MFFRTTQSWLRLGIDFAFMREKGRGAICQRATGSVRKKITWGRIQNYETLLGKMRSTQNQGG
jgi:hypothetical protein